MKTVMIPSDFSQESVQIAEAFVRDSTDEVRLVFSHFFHVADDIQDLLFSNYREKEYDLVSEDFWRECNVLKGCNEPRIKSIRVAFYYGNKLASFKNFLEANEVDCIAYSENYGVPKLSKSSLDALPVIKKAGIPLLNTDLIKVSVLSDSDTF